MNHLGLWFTRFLNVLIIIIIIIIFKFYSGGWLLINYIYDSNQNWLALN